MRIRRSTRSKRARSSAWPRRRRSSFIAPARRSSRRARSPSSICASSGPAPSRSCSTGGVLDLLGEGELFGHASMLSGLPTGFEARAGEETRLLSDPRRGRAGAAVPARPACGSSHARCSTVGTKAAPARATEPGVDPPLQPVGGADPRRCRWCAAGDDDPRGRGADDRGPLTSAVVDLGDGSLGILTDRDLRTRVVASGLTGDAPVSAAMSAPAYTCSPDRLGGDVLLDMLDRGFRHFPVVSATGHGPRGHRGDRPRRRADALARSSCAGGSPGLRTVDELIDAARELRPTVIATARRTRRAGQRRRGVLGRRRRADAPDARARGCRARLASASSSRGSRSAARRGARRCRART